MSALPPPGEYWCKLRDHQMLMTKDDKPFLLVRFVVLDGAADAAESALTGELRKYFTQDAMKYTVRDLRYLGFAGGSFAQLDHTVKTPASHSFAGTVVKLKAELEEYGGKTRLKWECPYTGAAGRPLSDNKRAWLAEMSTKFLADEEDANETPDEG